MLKKKKKHLIALRKILLKASMVVHAWNPSTWKVKAGGSQSGGQLGLHSSETLWKREIGYVCVQRTYIARKMWLYIWRRNSAVEKDSTYLRLLIIAEGLIIGDLSQHIKILEHKCIH
jgi:hypothetical protein